MQQEEQMQIQRQQEEQMRMQQQQEEQKRIQEQQQAEQMKIQQQQEEQMRIQQQQAEQMKIQQQQAEQMRIQQQQEEQRRIQQQEEKRKSAGFAVETRPDPVLSQPKPQMTSSSFSESHQTQSSSVQQSSSSYSHQEASRQVFESQEFNGGYQAREDVAIQQSNTGERNIQDSGVFGGIGGDRNSLVDAEFDYKKHSVKDLAKHFALVKPKQDISHNILPEQRMYNGNNGPALNYLSSETSQTSSSSVTTSRREVSQQDVEASKRAYEMK